LKLPIFCNAVHVYAFFKFINKSLLAASQAAHSAIKSFGSQENNTKLLKSTKFKGSSSHEVSYPESS
jgi:hypothetical protein